MYARIATFEGGDNERLRAMNEERIESGTMEFPNGMKRAMVLHDGEADRRMFVSFFETRDEVTAAEQQFEAMGDSIPEDIRGSRVSVGVYEVLFDREV